MGTKNNPGAFDCYANAQPDEPMFVLLARDLTAPYFVQAWALIREGRIDAAIRVMRDAADLYRGTGKVPDKAKLAEAMDCANEMTIWWGVNVEQRNA